MTFANVRSSAHRFTASANFLVPRDPLENTIVKDIAYSVYALRLLNKFAFSRPIQKGSKKVSGGKIGSENARLTGAVIDAILVVPGLICIGWHLYELGKTPDTPDRSAAIVEEVSNIAGSVQRVSYFVAVNDPEPVSKEVAIGLVFVAFIAVAGLQTVEAAIRLE